MASTQKIRVIALGLIQDGDCLFVSQGYDAVKETAFYRALGGGLEFGETSVDALQREFYEEIQASLTNIQYLGCLENLFTFNGKPGHEIIQLYRCDFADPSFYQREHITFTDGDGSAPPVTALWIDLNACKSGKLRLVPEGCLPYLSL